MSKKRFTPEEVKILRENENVDAVSEKYISYKASFKELCISNVERGISLRDTFSQCGLDPEIIGIDRMKSAYDNWKWLHGSGKKLKTGHYGGGRPRTKPMTDAEKIALLEKRVEQLEAENDFLCQLRRLERRHQPQKSPSEKDSKQ